eukprot:JP447130.1.p1 GENE.JP447130.1~~JP447130.1.p1  ORF type:complete len:155 (+),score=45.63 JP447130.1:16-480(+)
MSDLYTFSNPTFCKAAGAASVLIFKTYGLTFTTVFNRITKNKFVQPEDYQGPKAAHGIEKMDQKDPTIERIRAAHFNDTENIPLFIGLSMFYVATVPSAREASIVFGVYVAGRVIHTVTYLFKVQPFRALSFIAGVGAQMFMSSRVLQKAIANM